MAYSHFGAKGKDLSMPAKFTTGMLFMLIRLPNRCRFPGMWFADAQGLTSPWFVVLIYLFQSLGN